MPMDERSILIVDDNEDVRHVLRMLFEHDGYVVAGEAGDGVEAVMLARQTQPRIIVLDQKMPGMTGEKTAEVLRALCPDTRIVAFSAFLQQKPVWADAFLNKDRIGEIVPLLARLVEPRRTIGQSEDLQPQL
jgi:CheY-like chemotaxis protein